MVPSGAEVQVGSKEEEAVLGEVLPEQANVVINTWLGCAQLSPYHRDLCWGWAYP